MIFERGDFDNNAIQESVINESLNEVRTFSIRAAFSAQPTIFLSHKHSDLKDLRGVMGLIKSFGTKIYIDSMDNKMPNQTSGDTALRIKDVIKYCDKFMFLATDKAIESYWCNWELGIGDINKYIKHIAIIPMKEKGKYDSEYKGNEYLQIYPQLEYRDGTTKYNNGNFILKGYYIRTPSDKDGNYTITPIQEWLKAK
jgi:hypothetical protein